MDSRGPVLIKSLPDLRLRQECAPIKFCMYIQIRSTISNADIRLINERIVEDIWALLEWMVSTRQCIRCSGETSQLVRTFGGRYETEQPSKKGVANER